jgi:outer membrane protein assembly factor BamD (BamD/ComL family)
MRSAYLGIGVACVILGGSVFAVYNIVIKPEREAKAILTESALIMEKGDKDSLSRTINTLRTIFVKYPETKAAPEAYFMTAQAYERLGLYRIAYIKYGYLLRKPLSIKTSDRIKNEAAVHMNKIKILRSYSEEGIHNLYGMLGAAQNTDLRSKIYAELGQAYLRGGDTRRARNSFDIAMQENSSNEEAIIGKARTLKRSGLDDEAFLLYDYFIKYFGAVSPYTNDVRRTYMHELYSSGLRSYRAGGYYKAIDYFNRYLSRFGDSRLSENSYYWAGESYYSLRNYGNAVRYFDRVLTNGYYHKDEDARIKKGFSLFMLKRYDLAAKEFVKYLKDFPRGRFADDARRWHDMSTQEIQPKDQVIPQPRKEDLDRDEDRIEENKSTEDKETPAKDDPEVNNTQPKEEETRSTSDEPKEEDKDNPFGNEEVFGQYRVEPENIAEM